jgi:hypothetical protein
MKDFTAIKAVTWVSVVIAICATTLAVVMINNGDAKEAVRVMEGAGGGIFALFIWALLFG